MHECFDLIVMCYYMYLFPITNWFKKFVWMAWSDSKVALLSIRTELLNQVHFSITSALRLYHSRAKKNSLKMLEAPSPRWGFKISWWLLNSRRQTYMWMSHDERCPGVSIGSLSLYYSRHNKYGFLNVFKLRQFEFEIKWLILGRSEKKIKQRSLWQAADSCKQLLHLPEQWTLQCGRWFFGSFSLRNTTEWSWMVSM